jgi:hypothetical protein
LHYLISVQGFIYASFLMRTVPSSALPGLAEKVQATLRIAVQRDRLVDIGLHSLNRARIAVLAGDKTAVAQFDTAVAALRKAGARHYIPLGYLARAGFRRLQGDLGGA